MILACLEYLRFEFDCVNLSVPYRTNLFLIIYLSLRAPSENQKIT